MRAERGFGGPRQAAPPMSITCPACERTSYNGNDVREGYCGYCHWWTGDAMLSPPGKLAELRAAAVAEAAAWLGRQAADGRTVDRAHYPPWVRKLLPGGLPAAVPAGEPAQRQDGQ